MSRDSLRDAIQAAANDFSDRGFYRRAGILRRALRDDEAESESRWRRWWRWFWQIGKVWR